MRRPGPSYPAVEPEDQVAPAGREAADRSGTPSRAPVRGLDDEAGFAGGFEGLVFGLLVFVAGGLLIAHAWAMVSTKFAVSAAAQEAARAYVKAPVAPPGDGGAADVALEQGSAMSAADSAAADALAGFGRTPSAAAISIGAGPYAHCSRVTVTVSYPSPVLELPIIGGVGSAERISSSSSQLLDSYRSGIQGAGCAGG